MEFTPFSTIYKGLRIPSYAEPCTHSVCSIYIRRQLQMREKASSGFMAPTHRCPVSTLFYWSIKQEQCSTIFPPPHANKGNFCFQHDGKVPSVKPRCLSWGRDGAADADMKWEELWNRWTHPCLSLTAYIGWSPTERIFRKLRHSLYVRMQSIKKVGQCQSSVSELSVKAVKKKKTGLLCGLV